jgi:hypothetical protein
LVGVHYTEMPALIADLTGIGVEIAPGEC